MFRLALCSLVLLVATMARAEILVVGFGDRKL